MKILKINKKTNVAKIVYDGELPETNKEKYDFLISDNFKHYFPEWMIDYIDRVKTGDFNLKELEDDNYENFFEYVEDEWMLDTIEINDILKDLSEHDDKYIIEK